MQPETLRKPILLLVVLVLTTALLWLWFDMDEMQTMRPMPRGLERSLLPRPVALPDFQLIDFDGQPFGPEQLKGRWSFVFFGYTHCPDICPTTLFTLKEVHKRLQQSPDILRGTQFLFVSLDPKRDTPDLLKRYVTHFEPSFIAASAEHAILQPLTAQLGVSYAIDGDASGNDYLVNHSASILLIDPQGQHLARFATTLSAEALEQAFRRIHAFYSR